MDVLVVDDDKLARDRLTRMVQSFEGYDVLGTLESGEEAIRQVINLEPDVVLLDARMTGMETAEKLSSLAAPPAIIYCKAFDEHAFNAKSINASLFLVKPVRREALLGALATARRFNGLEQALKPDKEISPIANTRSHISARTRRGIKMIPLTEVKFFQADQKYVTVRHEGGEVLIDDTLRDLESEFGDRLVRIHRNALVMMDQLVGLEKNPMGHYQVRMRGIDERLDVSRRHLSGIRKIVQTL